MNDRPAASIAFWFASEIMPASATTVTSGRRWAAMNASMTGSIDLASDAPVPEPPEERRGRQRERLPLRRHAVRVDVDAARRSHLRRVAQWLVRALFHR